MSKAGHLEYLPQCFVDEDFNVVTMANSLIFFFFFFFMEQETRTNTISKPR